jgi:histidyl-tRNA synthetase
VSTKAIFFNMGESESKYAYKIMQELRELNIACEMYHEAAKMEKQFKYAEKKNISYVIIIGSKEIEEKTYIIKQLTTGIQERLSFDELKDKFIG